MVFRCEPEDDEYKDTIKTLLDASRADSTVHKYNRLFAQWEKWAIDMKLHACAASAEDIARYLICLYNGKAPFSRIQGTFYAIKWKIDCNPNVVVSPCDSKFLSNLLLGITKLQAKPIVKKEPITPDMIKHLIGKFGRHDNLKDIRLCTMILLSYSGFLRFNELINIRRCDIQLFVSHANIFISKSKTDIFRQGAWVLVGATGSLCCPVSMLKRYLDLAQFSSESDEKFLIRPVQCIILNQLYRLRDGQLSYTRCLEIFKEALADIGINPKSFGLHSLRAGGATAAANYGVPDRLFKKHGRWRSETAKDGYVKDSIQNRLSVSLNLGL